MTPDANLSIARRAGDGGLILTFIASILAISSLTSSADPVDVRLANAI
jgi:hypothetical protein